MNDNNKKKKKRNTNNNDNINVKLTLANAMTSELIFDKNVSIIVFKLEYIMWEKR